MLWVVIKRETREEKIEEEGERKWEQEGGRKTEKEITERERGERRVEEEEGIRCANSMRLVQCESSRGKLARGCCSRFPDLTTLNKLPMQI